VWYLIWLTAFTQKEKLENIAYLTAKLISGAAYFHMKDVSYILPGDEESIIQNETEL